MSFKFIYLCVKNVNQNLNITWNISPSGGFTLTPLGTSITLIPNGNFSGTATLTASINSSCGGQVSVSKDIQSGAYRPIKLDRNGNEIASFQFPTMIHQKIYFDAPPNTTEWEWRKVAGNFYLMANSNNSATVFSHSNTFGIIDVRVKNSNCGWSPRTMLVVNFTSNKDENFLFRTYPNPAKNTLNITEISTEKLKKRSLDKKRSSSISLYDFNGNLVKKLNSSTGILNLNGLRKGRYILVISENNHTEKHHIIIE